MFRLKPSLFTEICGWYGMIVLIVAYALASFGMIPADGLLFQFMNITGGIGMIIIAASKDVTPSVILNIFWVAIGCIAVLSILF